MPKGDIFTSHDFRAELMKVMPGYAWTIHRQMFDHTMVATGTQSSGFNRLSTLQVTRSTKLGRVMYEAKSSGYGTRSPWLGSVTEPTLARALRELQKFFEGEALRYQIHAAAMQSGRKAAEQSNA